MQLETFLALHGVSRSVIQGNDHESAADRRRNALAEYAEAKLKLFETGFAATTIEALDTSTRSELDVSSLVTALRISQLEYTL